MKNKYLVIPNGMPSVDSKSLEINFLFPVKGFCVGFTREYEIEKIPKEAYIYINRILDQKSIEALKEKLKIYSFEGVVFEDLGIYELIKDTKMKKIFFASHASCSLKTVETYLRFMDGVILSPDITEEEITNITHSLNRVGVYLYGPLPYMYSRRHLVKNYQTYYELESNTYLTIQEMQTKKKFVLIENEYGTVVFDEKVLDVKELLKVNAHFYLVNFDWEEDRDFKTLWSEFQNQKNTNSTMGFTHQKTIYRLPVKGGDSK